MAPIVIHGARYHHLRGDVYVRPGSLSRNLYSVRDGRGGSMSPARPTVLRNVLVSQVCEIVYSVDVVPDKVLWEINSLKWCLLQHRLDNSV